MISIVANLAIIGLTIWGITNSYIKDHGFDDTYSRYKLLTFDSNIITAIVSIVYIIFTILLLTNKNKQINISVLICRLVATGVLGTIMMVIFSVAIVALIKPEFKDLTKYIFKD